MSGEILIGLGLCFETALSIFINSVELQSMFKLHALTNWHKISVGYVKFAGCKTLHFSWKGIHPVGQLLYVL